MLIYRVQTRLGSGPFTTGAAYNVCGRERHAGERFPAIYMDAPSTGKGWHCACPSIETLLEWFPLDALRAFMNRGQFVHVYHVVEPFVVMGRSRIQCAFRRQYADLVEVWYSLPAEVEEAGMKAHAKVWGPF